MIGYYIHHQGSGHLARAQSICARMDAPVTALSSLPIAQSSFDSVVRLPSDDDLAAEPVDPTASGILHWVPLGDSGLRERMAAVARWIDRENPAAVVVDVSVEIALLARLHGVPVIAMVLPGQRIDTPHRLVHRVADALIAAWPREVYDPVWLREYRGKTHYVGGISRFADRPKAPRRSETDRPTVLVLAGGGGSDFTSAAVEDCADRHRRYRWRTAGVTDWIDDPWPLMCEADVIVSHAGQGAVADIAAAAKPAVLVPAARPFGEQHATATALAEAGMAVIAEHLPALDEWPALLDRARHLDHDQWLRWRVDGATTRAAAVIADAAGKRRAA
ncbi:glycosyltransferase [Nocardia asteroides]|uniref:glycosyltransferase n=1 Tax=Nocardia asteroides TaxID=1824 RepID=UPI00365ADCA0